MTFNRRSALGRIFAATVVTVAAWGVMPAMAQERWPAKPVRLVVPFSPGGSTDVVARMIGQKLSVLWGQPVIVENRAGAGGNLGADMVAKSPADGYTLLMASGSITINPHIYKNMPFDTRKDLAPITNVASGPMLLVVPDRAPVKSVKELITLAKETPGALNFGSAGVGSQVHLAGENFADAARIEIRHVPYRGEAVAYNDLIAGQIQMMVGNFAAASALLGPGRLRALAVTGKQRSEQLPDVPTVAESGLPGFENTGWFGFLAPAGTPQGILSKIQIDTAKVLAESDTKARLFVQGMTPVGNTPAEFSKAMDAESKQWATLVKNRNITTN
ncbi:tripartite tricarboxylate transporter substrate binding protein [Polaromonas sp. CG_9.11]|uniref:tripartite tricarboxylate transporter substrate binding protein n=1 Tax=Polaromonas sp. CG_9.11 TaxID=2787730 RepID=UPI0018C8EA5F|nr:tripartite tricarboxylate transporter substrate binding protein [Polaromonas sp. CG_9.11]MBG6076928.1 tripartite-type tricarboxylate transporter receptor subunit TctC [Polaromonas sp. CG_9.11]